MTDVFDPFDTNVTASILLNIHHDVVGISQYGDGVMDNCAVCGFAVGWIQDRGQGREGHATSVTTEDVRAWIKEFDSQ